VLWRHRLASLMPDDFCLSSCCVCQASSDGIEKRRLPPPLNIFMAALLFIVDLIGALSRCCRESDAPGAGESGEFGDTGSTAANNGGGGVAAGAAPASGSGPPGSSGTRASNADRYAGSKDAANNDGTTKPSPKALSQTNVALILRGALERLLFACSMGLAALALSAALWVLSLPSVVGRVVRWMPVS